MSEEKIINQKEKCLSQKTRATTDEIKHWTLQNNQGRGKIRDEQIPIQL